MTDHEATAEVTLVQFKCKEPPKSDLVRALTDETIDQALARRQRNREATAPEHYFRHTGVIPEQLMRILNEEKLKLVDAYFQRRVGLDNEELRVRYHILVTFKFAIASAKTPPERQKELDAKGMRVLQAYLDQRWERVIVAAFPDAPGLKSACFVGKAQSPNDPVPIKDEEAAKFGMVITRRKPAMTTT